MTIFPIGKGGELFQPNNEMPVKPSLLILTNAKDSEIIDLLYYHAS